MLISMVIIDTCIVRICSRKKSALLIKSLKVVLSCVIRLSIMVLQYGRQAGIIWKKAESSNRSKTSFRHAFLVY